MFATLSAILMAESSDNEKIDQLRALVATEGQQILTLRGEAKESENANVCLLHRAAVNCGVDVFKYLLGEAPGLFHELSNGGTHFIWYAAKFANVAVVNYAIKLEGGSDAVKMTNKRNLTALYFAALGGNVTIFNLFQEIRGDWLFRRDHTGISANYIIEIIENGKPQLVPSIIKKFKISPQTLANFLIAAVNENNAAVIKYLLVECGINVNQGNQRGNTALMRAAANANKAMLDLLLENQANIFQVNNNGWGPLHDIVDTSDSSPERQQCLKQIIEMQLQLSLKYAPSHSTLQEIKSSILKTLVSKSTIQNDNFTSYTPLQLAAKNNNVIIARILVNYGADFFELDAKGRTAYHIAARWGAKAVLEYVASLSDFKTMIDLPMRNDGGNTALHQAINYGHRDAAFFLIQQQADPLRYNKKGWTPWHSAAYKGCAEIIEDLIAFRGKTFLDFPTLNEYGNTALHLAIYHGKFTAGRVLINQGADLFKLNLKNEMPIQYIILTDTRLANFILASLPQERLNYLATLNLLRNKGSDAVTSFASLIRSSFFANRINFWKLLFIYELRTPTERITDFNELIGHVLPSDSLGLNRIILLSAFDWEKHKPVTANDLCKIMGLYDLANKNLVTADDNVLKKVYIVISAIMTISAAEPQQTLSAILECFSEHAKDMLISDMILKGIKSCVEEDAPEFVAHVNAKRKFLGEEKSDMYSLESKIDLVNIESLYRALHELFFSKESPEKLYLLKNLMTRIKARVIINHIVSFLISPEIVAYRKKSEDIPSRIEVRDHDAFDVATAMLQPQKVAEEKETGTAHKKTTTALTPWLSNQTAFFNKLDANLLARKVVASGTVLHQVIGAKRQTL